METGQPEFFDRTGRLLQELFSETDDRVRRELMQTPVGLTGDPSVLTSQQGEMVTALALNILARTFARVCLLPPLGTELLGSLYEAFRRRWGFPWTELGVGMIQPNARCDLALAVGDGSQINAVEKLVTVGVNGWISEYEEGPGPVPVADLVNPVGAAVAVCLGVARLFAMAVRPFLSGRQWQRMSGPERLRWSTFSYLENDENPPIPSELRLDDVVMVGVGGVGVAAATVLGWTPGLRGTLVLVDADRLDGTNLNRFLPVSQSTIGELKTDVMARYLSFVRPELQVLSAPMSYRAFVRRAGRPQGVVVSTVDNEQARAFIQSDLPRLVIDGATSGPVLGVSRHDFLDGACLGCLHPRTVDPYAQELQMAKVLGLSLGDVIERLADDRPLPPAELQLIARYAGLGMDFQAPPKGKPLRVFWAEDVCGKITVKTEDENEITGSAAFVSVMAGALAAGEVIKDAANLPPLNNQFMMQIFRGPTAEFPRRRDKDPKCRCFCSEEAMRQAYLDLHGSTQRGIIS
ncbi:MAG: ThiF family adenylyltransferase [Bacillota bacterium]